MKAIYNNTTNSLIAFKGDHRPIQIRKGGQLIDNISAVPLITEQDTYASEYKANLVGLELQGNTVVVNDYTNQVMDLIKSGNYSQAGVSYVALVNVPSELVDKNITYYLSASLPSGYSIGLLKGSNFLFGDSVAINTIPITKSGFDGIYITGITSDEEILSLFENVTLYAQEKADAGNIDVELKLPIIPSEYQQVEYIESTGTQYIDTGFIPTINTKIISKVQMNYAESTMNKGRAGMVYKGSLGWIAYGDYGLGTLCAYFSKTSRAGAEIPFDTDWHTYHLENGLQKIDDVQATNTVTSIDAISLYLLGVHINYDEQTISSQRFAYAKIWDNGVIVRDYIPCYRKADGEIGLYDLANDVFYTNQGTGNFKKGNDVVPTVVSVNIPYTLATVDKLTLKDKKVMLNNTDITSTEVGQNLLALAEATQNQTNIIKATSEIPLSKKKITYAKWGGDNEN